MAIRKPTKNRISGMLETAVSRWCQKWPVPSRAEPRPRTRASGVRMSLISKASPRHVAGDPHQKREHDRTGERGPGHACGGLLADGRAGVPDQMADAAQHVVEQRPG